MYNTPYQRGSIHIHERLLHNLVLGEEIYQISNSTKTSVNKRLKLCHAMSRLGCTRGKTVPPAFPSVKHHGGKSTTLIGDMQGGEGFFCRLAIGGRRRSKGLLRTAPGEPCSNSI